MAQQITIRTVSVGQAFGTAAQLVRDGQVIYETDTYGLGGEAAARRAAQDRLDKMSPFDLAFCTPIENLLVEEQS